MHKKLVHLFDKLRFLWYFMNYLAAFLVSPFFRNRPEYQHLWLVSERGIDAQDNGLHLYRYLRREHPELNVRYLIDDSSPDRRFFSDDDRLLRFRSFSHYLALVLAEYKISTHIMGFAPDMWFFLRVDKVWKISGKLVFLQHGITSNDMPWMYADNARLHLFVCGAKPEADAIEAGFGHPKGVVQYLGFCRYDKLPTEPSRRASGMVLFMPTWLQSMKDVSVRVFTNSDYYRGIMALLNDEALETLLEKHGKTLMFAPHHEVLPYLGCFHSSLSRVRFLDAGNRNVQQLLIDADVLITDFSSVFYDFAYQHKPLIYYQFDEEEYRRVQYQQGYFDFRRDGFGPVVTTVPEVVRELGAALEFGMQENYASRLDRFFPIRDQNNCRRNYEAILALGKDD